MSEIASGQLPSEEVYEAMVADIVEGSKSRTIGKVGTRLNYAKGGISSLFRKSGRRAKKITEPPFKDALIKVDKKWGDVEIWRVIKRESGTYTPSYYLSAIDMKLGSGGGVEAVPEERQIYI